MGKTAPSAFLYDFSGYIAQMLYQETGYPKLEGQNLEGFLRHSFQWSVNRSNAQIIEPRPNNSIEQGGDETRPYFSELTKLLVYIHIIPLRRARDFSIFNARFVTVFPIVQCSTIAQTSGAQQADTHLYQ